MQLLHERPKTSNQPPVEVDVLIREARRLRRRRWVIGVSVAVVIAGGSATLTAVTTRSSTAKDPATTVSDSIAPALPVGAYAALKVAGPLAVAPDGRLYVTDTVRDQVLVRVPNGRFRVIAGSGKVGVSGGGGPAVDAALSRVSDLAFAPDGSLYIADGSRVRVVSPKGIIRTVAGSGRLGKTVANGTPALSASLTRVNSLAIALSPSGQLYISTGAQLLRLVDGKLDVIRTRAVDPPYNGRQLDDLGQIAVDAHGNVDVSGGNGWSIWRVAPDGTATVVAEQGARRSGGSTSVLERAPDGTVYGESGSTFLKLRDNQLAPIPFN